MDAKPYRPAFAVVNRGNENIPPAGKTIHQRHKSTGSLLNALSSQTNIAMKRNGLNDLKAAAKPPVSRDGLGTVAAGQENRGVANSKDAFLQPAQRPSKAVIPAASMSNLKPVAQDLLSKPLSKPPSKRNAPIAVYNDNPSVTDMPNASRETKPTSQQPSLDTTSRPVGSTRHYIKPEPRERGWSTVEPNNVHLGDGLRVEDGLEHFQQSSKDNKRKALSQEVEIAFTHRADDDATEALYLDAVEELPGDKYPVLVAEKSENWDPVSGGCLACSPGSEEEEAEGVEAKPSDTHDSRPSSAQIDDQADLSDYEDDEYDDQGYTTAHSARDNTTGGVTTVMVPPKLTKKGVAEIAAAKEMVEARRTFGDPDDDETFDISMVTEYGEEIFSYMKEVEMELRPDPHYMDSQTELRWSMRAVLIDWVVQVHTRFGLLPETLFLTVNFIDRFLSLKIVSINKLQLVGATALLLAAKYEEINCPSVQEIVYMVDGGYTLGEVVKAERFMLCMLSFKLGWPGPMSFIRRISKADDYDNEIRTVAKYFLEVAIMDERFVATPPSYLAAGAQCLSRMILDKGDWTPDHVYYSGYTYSQLKPLIAALLGCCRIARKHHNAVFEKYSLKQFKRAATYVETQIMQGFTLPFQQSGPYHVPDEYLSLYPEQHAITMPIPIMG